VEDKIGAIEVEGCAGAVAMPETQVTIIRRSRRAFGIVGVQTCPFKNSGAEQPSTATHQLIDVLLANLGEKHFIVEGGLVGDFDLNSESGAGMAREAKV
jgi:hypothetical protein